MTFFRRLFATFQRLLFTHIPNGVLGVFLHLQSTYTHHDSAFTIIPQYGIHIRRIHIITASDTSPTKYLLGMYFTATNICAQHPVLTTFIIHIARSLRFPSFATHYTGVGSTAACTAHTFLSFLLSHIGQENLGLVVERTRKGIPRPGHISYQTCI